MIKCQSMWGHVLEIFLESLKMATISLHHLCQSPKTLSGKHNFSIDKNIGSLPCLSVRPTRLPNLHLLFICICHIPVFSMVIHQAVTCKVYYNSFKCPNLFSEFFLKYQP